jgi:3-oxosteroid 1-dehydrogenase
VSKVCDVVVVGAGAGGLVAALTGRANGLDVVVIEKSEYVGGTSALSHGGLWFPNHPLMAEAGFTDSVEAGVAYLQSVVGDFGPAATLARQEAYIRGARRMLVLLRKLGLRFVMISDYADYYPENPGGTLEGRMIDSPLFDGRRLERWPERVQPRPKLPGGLVVSTLEEFRALFMLGRSRAARLQLAKLAVNSARLKARGVKPLVLGAAFVGQLLLAAQQQGVRFRTRTRMQELLFEGGRVVGVVVEADDGRREEIRARAGVILSAGGYAHDFALGTSTDRPRPRSTGP